MSGPLFDLSGLNICLTFREAYFFMGAVMLLGCPVVLLSPLAEKRSNLNKNNGSERGDFESQKIVKN